jgi:CheY-like chemotaxis protein
MVVDDEQVVCMAVSKMLEQEGFRVSTCRNGREAIEHYRRHWREVGLVLLDLIMPELDGKATYRSLKEINPEVAVLLCSGYSLDGDAQALLDSGADGFIQKPFRRPELIEEISRLQPRA